VTGTKIGSLRKSAVSDSCQGSGVGGQPNLPKFVSSFRSFVFSRFERCSRICQNSGFVSRQSFVVLCAWFMVRGSCFLVWEYWNTGILEDGGTGELEYWNTGKDRHGRRTPGHHSITPSFHHPIIPVPGIPLPDALGAHSVLLGDMPPEWFTIGSGSVVVDRYG
jgi:hypothetical protein